MSGTHPGFSAHVGDAIPFEDEKAIEDVACCLVRSPLSLKKLVYLDGQKAVLYRSRLNPSLGRNFEAMDPLEWLARMTDHIPDPGRHRTHFHGFYASRVRAKRREAEPLSPPRRARPPQETLLAELGEVDQQGVSGRSPGVQSLRRSPQDRRLHHRRVVRHSHPRPSGPESAAAGKATTRPGADPGAGGRGGARAPGRLRTAPPRPPWISTQRGSCPPLPRPGDVEEHDSREAPVSRQPHSSPRRRG
jgi:hypothetical protein